MTFSKEENPELDSTTKTVECSESSDEKSIDDEHDEEVELEDLTSNSGFGTIGGIGGIGSLGGSTSNFGLANMDAQWGFQSRGSIASEMDWMAEFGGEDDDDDVFPLGDDSDVESDDNDNNNNNNNTTGNNNPEALLGATMAALTISEDAEMTEENMNNSMSLNLTAPVAARQMIRRQSASRILLANKNNKKKSTNKNIDNMILPGSPSTAGIGAGGSAERRAKIRASMLGFAGAMGDSMKLLEETAEEEEEEEKDAAAAQKQQADTKQSKTKSSSSKGSSSSSSKVRRHSYDSKRSNSSSSSSSSKRAELMAKQRQVMSMRNFKTKNLGYRDLKSRENDSATRRSVIASSLEVHS